MFKKEKKLYTAIGELHRLSICKECNLYREFKLNRFLQTPFYLYYYFMLNMKRKKYISFVN